MTDLFNAIKEKQDLASRKIVAFIHQQGLEAKRFYFAVKVTNKNDWPFIVFENAVNFACRDLSDEKTIVRVKLRHKGIALNGEYDYDVELEERAVTEPVEEGKETLVELIGCEKKGLI